MKNRIWIDGYSGFSFVSKNNNFKSYMKKPTKNQIKIFNAIGALFILALFLITIHL